LVTLVALPAGAATDRAERLARELLIADTHIDTPIQLEFGYRDVTVAQQAGEFDYPRALAGGLNVAFMSIYTPAAVEEQGGSTAMAHRLIDRVEALVGRAPDKFAIPHSVADVRRHREEGLISLALGMENGGPLAGDLDRLRLFQQRGVRYITLAHSKSNHISDSSYDDNKRWDGLSPFGKVLVPAMNELGVMIDVSHLSDAAFYQVIALSKTPVLASHSSARHFLPGFERNISDDMIRQLAAQGGVVQINFGSKFVSQTALEWDNAWKSVRDAYAKENEVSLMSDEVTALQERYREEHPYPYVDLSVVLDHIDHVVGIGGIDSVGLGSDFDGVGDTLPIGLKDVSMYPNLVDGLLERGYDEAAIAKILGENLMRVWEANERFASRRAAAAPTTTGTPAGH
jgi:membrane dipeptidase